jgi:hypothetical protein
MLTMVSSSYKYGILYQRSLPQNPLGFGEGFGKNGQKPVFSSKSKVAFPKAEVLGKPRRFMLSD